MHRVLVFKSLYVVVLSILISDRNLVVNGRLLCQKFGGKALVFGVL
jgi:hypothetical protein